jgi:hypothetical protein
MADLGPWYSQNATSTHTNPIVPTRDQVRDVHPTPSFLPLQLPLSLLVDCALPRGSPSPLFAYFPLLPIG